MKKALTLIGILCLLLAFVLPIFAGPMSIMETPIWDSTPHSSNNPIEGHENPMRSRQFGPLLQEIDFIGTYEVTRINFYVISCNYLTNEIEEYQADHQGRFPEGMFYVAIHNESVPDSGFLLNPIAEGIISINNIMDSPSWISLEFNNPIIHPGTYTITFGLGRIGGGDFYDICVYRSLHDQIDGRGYYTFSGGQYIAFPSGEGNDHVMKVYGNEMVINGNGDGTIIEPDCDGDGIPDAEDDDDDNDCQGTTQGILQARQQVPLLTAFLFALGCVLLTATLVSARSMYGIIFYVVEFSVTFLLWYFWLFYAWTGIWV